MFHLGASPIGSTVRLTGSRLYSVLSARCRLMLHCREPHASMVPVLRMARWHEDCLNTKFEWSDPVV